MDIVSIPQVNRSSQRLAVASLPTFASCCSIFVVVAPDATHADTGCVCDSKTFRRRAWCRAELTACWARNGSDGMYYSTNSGLKPLAPNRPRDALDVFGGDLTCCAKCHPDGQACDKELLVLPMLGLFDEIYRDRNGTKADAWTTIERRGLDKLYPKTFLWTRTADDVQTRPLFGDLIAACMASRDAAAAGSKPDLRGYAPGAPGTQAVRHAHSAPQPSKRSLLRAASSRLLSPPALLRSMSTINSKASSRDSSLEPTATPSGLSPSLTWHASAPSTRRPPRMVSFRHQDSGEIGDGDAVSPTESSAV
ncbi:unnamed protein product [Pelagomonas calceolata]|uniref:Uncharacterized protein n=2 Tax=Pelagomonas calceolata TaxID=35677 RepID=A0A8J2WT96_9STRA|nr:unnamed protein product [Pelagomonas calceolata]